MKLEDKATNSNLENYKEELESILQELQKSGYLNDEYLVNGYIKRCLGRGQGPKIITYKLSQLGLTKSQISTALNTEEVIQSISEAKIKISGKLAGLEDFKLRHKLYQRGF